MAKLNWLFNNGDIYYFGQAPKHLSGVSLNASNIVLRTVGETYQLVATAIPQGAVEQTGFTWSSSNTSIATVSSTGLVTCVTPGSATITVTTTIGGYTATCGVAASRTYTISWEEKSDMSSGWTYSDDAAGLTAGSTAFDEFFGYSAVRLDTSGNETSEITQEQSGGAGKLDITQLGTLTSGDNVMIKFPVRGIKMTKSGSIVTLSITDGLNREGEGYQYYAHSRGTLSNPIQKNALYLGAYKSFNSSNVLKSWSGKGISASNLTQQRSIDYARANDGNSGSGGYDIIGFYQREYINALYMMKYGNPNSQSVVGNGYIGGSAAQSTGGTNSQTNATYGTSGTGDRVKLFGLEDWRGNVREWVGGVCTDGSKNLWTALSGFVGSATTSSPYENTGATIYSVSSPFTLSSIVGNNKGLFMPLNTNNTSDTYYCDYTSVGSNAGLVYAGGSGNDGSNAGAFNLSIGLSATSATHNRIMYL